LLHGTENNLVLPMDELTVAATGRNADLFAEDLQRHWQEIREAVEGRRLLVLGGAGSIGSSTVSLLSEFDVACLHVVDQNENALAELVRDLRSRPVGLGIRDFRTLPIDLGSPTMYRHLRMERPYDLVLNFAALKHVRSEKDICSVLQILDTNLLKPLKCWRWLQDTRSDASYFSVSTDKAAEPANVMGASKRVMEHLMFCEKGGMSSAKRTTSSRFANVAFSNGSLLESFVQRFEKRQPIACPSDTRRFFISLREAGQICALATVCGPNRHSVIPRLNPEADARKLEDIAAAFLQHKGLDPHIYNSEKEARAGLSGDLLRNRYPLLLTPLDTAGEKTCETFIGKSETAVEFGMSSMLAIPHSAVSSQLLADFIEEIESLVSSPDRVVDKSHIVAAISSIVPEFHHLERNQSLDQRM
jgi:FlaA1/EpsC-like NDP-sugar epimerase